MKIISAIKKAKAVIDERILALCVGVFVPVMSYAQNSGNSGGLAAFEEAKRKAGGKKLDDVTKNVDALAGSTYNTVLTVSTLLGVFLVAISLWGFYKASKDERDTPKPAIVGLIIGGMMTAVSLIAAYSANTTTGGN